MWTANESLQRSRTTNRCQIKNCDFKNRQRIKKRESERRRFVKRNKSLTLFADLKQWSKVFCSSTLCDWNCFSLIRFYLCLQLQQFCIVHLHRLTSMYIYIYKKKVGSQSGLPGSLGFRVDRVSPGQLPGGFLLRARPVPGLGRPAGPIRVSKLWRKLLHTCNYLI